MITHSSSPAYLSRASSTRTLPVYEPATQEHRSRPVSESTWVRAVHRVLTTNDHAATVALVMLAARELKP